LGAFFALQKTRLCGGSVGNPSVEFAEQTPEINPLCGFTLIQAVSPSTPKVVSIIPMIGTLTTDFELMPFGQKRYTMPVTVAQAKRSGTAKTAGEYRPQIEFFDSITILLLQFYHIVFY
jgi:hypothetical protein